MQQADKVSGVQFSYVCDQRTDTVRRLSLTLTTAATFIVRSTTWHNQPPVLRYHPVIIPDASVRV
jgi:hypothetical protein